MTDFSIRLEQTLRKNGLGDLASPEALDRLEAIYRALVLQNETMNLTAITEEDEAILKHLVDSVTVAQYIPAGARVADVGAGAGFPSLPLAAVRPDLSIVPIDSTAKKIAYIARTAKALGLANVAPVAGRAEELAQEKEFRAAFDFVTARAVARMNLLVELAMPLVRTGGRFAAMKSVIAGEELSECDRAIRTLGGKVDKTVHLTLENDKESIVREIILIDKVKDTPAAYPRKFAQIKKSPL